MTEYIFLGQFVQESDEFYVSDPCDYKPKKGADGRRTSNALLEGCQILAAKKGNWNCWVLYDINEERCMELIAKHCDGDIISDPDLANYSDNDVERYWIEAGSIGVDSGQAGIYDLSHYRSDTNDDGRPHMKICGPYKKDGDLWYDMNCSITLDENLGAGIIPNGVVSSSGYGDGLYKVYVTDDGYIVDAVKIIFIGDDNSDESDSDF